MNRLRTLASKLVAKQPKRRSAVRDSAPTEALEDRVLLSNVTVELRNGDLVIEGDGNNNTVSIRQGFNVMVVEGHDGTTINGFNLPQGIIGSSVADDVRMNFSAGGNNKVLVRGLTIGDDVQYRGGSGQDQVAVTDGSIGGDVNMKTGDGADVAVVAGLEMDGKVTVNTGGGSDRVVVGGDLMRVQANVKTGGGRDQVVLGGFEGGAEATVKTGKSNDAVFIFDADLDRLNVNMGSGRDDVWMTNVNTAQQSKFKGGSDVDQIEFDNSNVPGSVSAFEGDVVLNGQTRAFTVMTAVSELFENL
jgi:hypothetical protein